MDSRVGQTIELRSNSEAETIALGQRLGGLLAAGDLLLLLGSFGAGKTNLTKGLAAGLGAEPDEVNSPSFVLVNEYEAGAAHQRMPIYHVDLYRIENEHDLSTVGLEGCLDGNGICVIEWGERAADWLPQDRLVIQIEETAPGARRLRLTPHGERYTTLLAELSRQEPTSGQPSELADTTQSSSLTT